MESCEEVKFIKSLFTDNIMDKFNYAVIYRDLSMDFIIGDLYAKSPRSSENLRLIWRGKLKSPIGRDEPLYLDLCCRLANIAHGIREGLMDKSSIPQRLGSTTDHFLEMELF